MINDKNSAMPSMIQRAMSIIFSMEGKYNSINPDDNGALSLGCCQWHGDRAKGLLQLILKDESLKNVKILDMKLVNEINSNVTWRSRKVETKKEREDLKMLLSTLASKETQERLAMKDVANYIKHVMSLGYTDEETIILLSDIENQGGSGASTRIGTNTMKKYGKQPTIDQVMSVALTDVVFKNYQSRRLAVYEKLMKKAYVPVVKKVTK